MGEKWQAVWYDEDNNDDTSIAWVNKAGAKLTRAGNGLPNRISDDGLTRCAMGLFKPKWMDKDEAAALRAVGALKHPKQMAQAALECPHRQARLYAVNRLHFYDYEWLQKISAASHDDAVRAEALKMMKTGDDLLEALRGPSANQGKRGVFQLKDIPRCNPNASGKVIILSVTINERGHYDSVNRVYHPIPFNPKRDTLCIEAYRQDLMDVLPQAHIPDAPQQAEYVIFLYNYDYIVGEYSGHCGYAYRKQTDVLLYHRPDMARLMKKTVVGGKPPEYKSISHVGYGTDPPAEDIAQHIFGAMALIAERMQKDA